MTERVERRIARAVLRLAQGAGRRVIAKRPHALVQIAEDLPVNRAAE